MKKILFSLSAVYLSLFSPITSAQQEPVPQIKNEAEQSEVVEIVDSVTGVSYEVDENGEFARIRATGEAELEFGDRKDIRMATQKATLRAKANIAKFLSERVTSEEVIDNVENVVTKTENADNVATKMENGENITTKTENGNKSANREVILSYLEKIHNSAEALLKGVIATKTDINKDEKYVQIELGISKKTMAAADTLKKELRTDVTEKKCYK
ncbi:hypothetical protein E4T80_00690 [Muribacter muris]|uniref:Uncharacterized protein n=1 Tax=Muribacter muris TaxID=67855 RepID=A0A4Y9K5R3_9PAST|nr:hypothetical protein [Muribacter muris]MBF0784000.1 hypothetical protein [Muribacter muris]MBF0827451.1 hypothetical protein [Muribacter muris]TFV13394.1 hypothetical protein E4T80_00690 [Muribacter muris]